MRRALGSMSSEPHLNMFYGQMAYHLGWVDEQFAPATLPPGKFLRPALVLWGCELASAGLKAKARATRRDQALPAAAAVELLHNFSLIHDDIEDRDELRRHRPTLWSIWGEAQGINTGDGMFCVMRLALWGALDRGLRADLMVQLARILDRTALTLCEGQFLDMSFETRTAVTTDQYLDMIRRKTAALMRASAEVGALIGDPEHPELAAALAEFGEALGMAFQLRDDVLGIWAESAALGKTASGDLRRKKMSLPAIRALTAASPADQDRFASIYSQAGPATEAEIGEMLAILERSGSRDWCLERLAEHCASARTALARAWSADETPPAAHMDLVNLIDYVASVTPR